MTAELEDLVVADNPAERRYEARAGSRVVGYSEYRPAATRRIFVHTVVDPEFEGRGIGSRLARGLLDDLRSRGLTATVHCPFIAAYLERHPEYDDLIVPRRRDG